MSIHKSLVAKDRLKRHRNVLTRTERLLKLEQEEKWAAGKDSVFSLPKVRVARLKKSHAKKKGEKQEGVEGAEAAEGAAEAAPAADAKK
ncbi:MAG: small basic protein [Planctomycetota bacterium]